MLHPLFRLFAANLLLIACHFALQAQGYTIDQTGVWDPDYTAPYEITIAEDGYSDEIFLDFDFAFFGNTYNSLWMGQDGFLTFDGPLGTTWDPQTLPDPTDPNNLIAGVWMDLDNYECMYGGCYTYETIGVAPNRRFVASWYINSYCGNYVETQIKLFESSNIIEIHTYYETFIIGLQGGGGGSVCDATQGLENSDGTAAYFLSDRNNNSTWQAPGDYVAFIPTFPNDAGIPGNVTTYCTGAADIVTIVRNYGSNTIDSVTVNWSWNGVEQTPVELMFPILPEQNVAVTLGTQSLTFGDTDTLDAWTSMPNGVSDSNPLNDAQGSYIMPGMQGTYTIGGTDPDFTTVQDAIDTLSAYGVCDSVILNIRPGTYNEQLEIGYISGAFGDNLVIFRSETGDSSDVIIEYASTSFSTNYVVLFSGARNIILEHLTLRATGTSYAGVVELMSGATDNTVRHCELQGHPTPSSSFSHYVIYSEGSNQRNTFTHNRLTGGSYSFYHYTDEDYGDYPEGIVFAYNNVSGFRTNGVYSENTIGMEIYKNVFTTSQSNPKGMEIYYDHDTLKVHNNILALDLGTLGMMFAFCEAPTSYVLAYNNAVAIAGTIGNARGLSIIENTDAGVYFNSVLMSNTASSSRALDMNSGTADFNSNIFANTGGGYAVQASNADLMTSDNNNLFATGPYLGRFEFTNIPDLPEWTMITHLDSTSLSVPPLFTSGSDLHTMQPQFNKRGIPVSGINDDMDGAPRDPLYPDLGADEFVPAGDDIGVFAFLSPADTCINEQEVKVLVRNFGSNQVTDYEVHWELDGVAQAPLIATALLDTAGGLFSDTAHVVLDTLILDDDQEITLKAWTSVPNGVSDMLPSNDTVFIGYRIPLSGIYTIGGTNPDFPSITAAVETMEDFRICGPVVFRLRNGVYNEQVVIDTIYGASDINTITFESESGDSSLVEWTASGLTSSSNYLLFVERADHLVFRNMRFNTSGNSFYGNILLFGPTASHMTIQGNSFVGRLNPSAAFHINKNAGAESSSFVIQNNKFLNGTYGVSINGQNFPNRAKGLVISGNTLINPRTTGIRVNNQDSCIIRNNTVYKTVTHVSSFTGIEIDNLSNDSYVNHNAVIVETAGTALDVNGANNFVGDDGRVSIYNNMIYASDGMGLRVWNSVRPLIAYNNVSSGGPDLSDYAFELVAGDSAYVWNNNFIANGGRAYSNTFTAPLTTYSNYNNLRTSGAQLGYWNGVSYDDLAAWQAGTAFDTNSMSVDPQFVSMTDLHVLADTLDGSGTPIAGIITDFDGQSRNATMPDIGADEIGANPNDAGIFAILPEMPFARGNQDIKAVIRNYGSNPITTVDIHWTIDEIPQTTYAYTGNLESLQQDTVILGSVNFSLATPYNFKAWTANPNMVTDLYNQNDTLTSEDRYAAVSDIVTIGGTSPDVATVDAAVTAMTLGGVLDSVHFHIRSGMYTGLITIPQNEMLTCESTVVFESETGNPEDVVLVNTGLSTTTLVLNGADGLTFRNLTIRNTESATHAIEVTNSANCNVFDGCIIEGIETTSTSNTRATVFSGGSTDTANVFINNIIRNGSFGIYWYGAADEAGTVFADNTIEDFYYIGFYTRYQSAPVISGNTLSTSSLHTNVTGCYLQNVDLNYRLTENRILLPGRRSTGIYLTVCAGSSLQRGLVANNYVRTGNNLASTGIYLSTTTYCDIYHNTVKMEGSHASSAAFYEYGSGTSYLNLQNNIFYVTSGGIAVQFAHSMIQDTSDYNCLYTNGSVLCKVSSTNYADLTSWQGTGQGTNSISEDPLFVSELDYQPTSAALNESGAPLAAVTIDVEGEPRDPVMPDMGCDEFSIYTDDVGLVAINYPTQPYPSGMNTVFVKFVNNGLDTLTTMQVDWEVNGIPQPTYYWTGLLPSADTYDSLDIGTFDFAPYTGHSIKVWVSQPNGVADGLATNDTLLVTGLYPGLLGDYTIGGMDPDFITIAEATDALHDGGAAGSVTFHIRTGTYLETINLNAFPGCGCDTPVVFTSEASDSSAVTITNLGIDDHTLTLDGTDGVIFQDLTLKSVNPAYRKVVEFFNGAHCNQFHRNTLSALATTSSSSEHAVVWSAFNSGDTANVFSHNRLLRGSYGFYLDGLTSVEARTVIERNVLSSPYYRGIHGDAENAIQIRNNTIDQGGNTSFTGIFLSNCSLDVDISANQVNAPVGSTGIYLNACIGGVTPGRVYNNFISVGGTSSAYGISLNFSSDYEILHNNINIYTSTGSSTNNTAFGFHDGDNVVLRNNIAYSQSPGYVVHVDGTTGFDSDYNDFSGSGVHLGYIGGAAQTDLAAWQSASGGDAHSVSVNPQFMSDADLHVTNAVLDSAGTDAGIGIDIDGDTRGTPPDIGADEFIPAANDDAGVFAFNGPVVPFAHGVQPVEVTLKNFGGNTLTSANVRWLVNGIEQQVFNWTGSLSAGGCDTISIGNYSFSEYTAHDFIVWTEMPNGVPDSTHVNDTLYFNDLYPALSGNYTVGGVLPDFNLLSQIQNALNKGGVLGDVVFDIRSGTYTSQLSILDYPGMSPEFEVTFRSESGDSSDVTILRDFNSGSGDNYTIRLRGARNVNFERISIKSTKGRVVDIDQSAGKIMITHCAIQGIPFPSNSSTTQLIYSPTSTEDSLVFSQNRFEYGAQGIHVSGSSGAPETGLRILNNQFINTYWRPVSVSYQNDLEIGDNLILNDTERGNAGMYIAFCDAPVSITGNQIISTVGHPYGLYMFDVVGTSGNPTGISNNYIYTTGGTGSVHGVYHGYGEYNNFYHNTIRIGNMHLDSRAFTDDNSYDNIEIVNCILANTGGGKTIHNSWAVGFHSNVMDYCNLYTTGPVLAYWFNPMADLAELQAEINTNLNSTDAEPLFTDDTYRVFQSALDNTGTSLLSVTTDIEGDARSGSDPDIGCDEFTLLTNDVGMKTLVSPETYCGLSSTEEVTIRIQNFGSAMQTGFDVAYSLNGAAWQVENVGALEVQPGQSVDYTFSTTEDLSTVGEYAFAAHVDLAGDEHTSNDTLWDIYVEHIPALTNPVGNMLPADGTLDLNKPVSLSWTPAPNATRYDVYIWEDGTSQPASPQISNITQINTLYHQLDFGTTYNWQVVAENSCDQMVPSEIQQFAIRKLPDLITDVVIAPATAFSGQQTEVEWQVKNLGPGATQSTLWSDAVYLSLDATLNTSFDTYLGSVQNLTALDSGAAYTNTGVFTIPNGITGEFYVFVFSDAQNNLIEISNTNNSERTSSQMQVSLTPSPDLVVDNIVVPSSGFSGQMIPISFEIRNNGQGPAEAMEWRDLVFLQPGNNVLKNIKRTTTLLPDSSYQVMTFVTLPEAIFGDYTLRVLTDAFNQLYEFGSENNNDLVSDTFEIFLTPPPDLVPVTIQIPDTVSSNELLTVSWEVENQGATGPVADYWSDRCVISPSPVFNPNFNTTLLTRSKSPPLDPSQQYLQGGLARIPAGLHGPHYLYVTTDYTQRVFEYTYEDNNTYRTPGVVYVASPDLHVDSVYSTTTALSGSHIPVSFRMLNTGYGDLIERTYVERYFLSTDQVLDGSDIEWLSVSRSGASGSLAKTDTLLRTIGSALPLGLTGNYYIIVHADANSQIYEEGSESNNILSSAVPINILPAPWPDLLPQSIIVPDTITAGTPFTLSFSILNQGGLEADVLGKEGIYVSFSPTWEPEFATKLFSIARTVELPIDSALPVTYQVTLPGNTVSNAYYFYVWIDEENVVFEDGLEANNIQRSDPVFVKPYPPVDLAVDTVSIATDTLMSGTGFQLSYILRNAGGARPLFQQWQDQAYLSVDSTLDNGLDIPLGSRTTLLPGFEAGDTSLQHKYFTLPHGVSGDYYLLLEADEADLNMDADRTNNVNSLRNGMSVAEKVHVKLSASPDLRIAGFTAPSTTISGQFMTVSWSVENTGTSTAYQWVDRLYLSADQTIGYGDRLLFEKRFFALAPGDTVNADTTFFIPASYNGNYVLILQTDAKNAIYEHLGENNNIVTRSLQVDQPPPSDLLVNSISLPANAIAGENVKISWNTANQGAFSASGALREIVYLSADPYLDVDDDLFGIRDGSVFLTPFGERVDSVTAPVLDVEIGDYYALVQTDARNNIHESNDSNNVSASLDVMHVDVNRLYLHYLQPDTLVNQKELYYKVIIPAAAEGTSLSVELFGDTLVSSNELYISYNQMPTRAEFDYGFDTPNQSYQRIIVPELQPGIYYVLVYGRHDTVYQKHIDLYARLINYELISVSPSSASNEGWATLTLKGANLDSTLQVRLTDTLDNYYQADTFIIVDDQKIIARFDLRSVPAGVFTIETTKGVDLLARLIDGFTVLEDGAPDLQVTHAFRPASFFQTTPVTKLVVEVINNGENDVENLAMQLRSIAGDQLAATLADHQSDQVQQVVLVPIGQDLGFVNVLAPGESFRLEYLLRTQPYPLVSITIVDNE